MAIGDRMDPFRAYSFLVEIDGITRAGFRECSGLDTSASPIEYREGDDAPTMQKLPGLITYGNITLSRGMTSDDELWRWRTSVVEGKAQRKNGSIILMDHAGSEVQRWNFREAWPTRWTGPSLNATSNEVAVEQLEIAHEGITRG